MPKKALKLCSQLDQYSQLETNTSTQRLLFQKVNKAFDQKTIQLAAAQYEIKQLKDQLEASKPVKRRKVKLSPNSKFASIEAIYRTKEATGDLAISADESNGPENHTDEEDCILVG